MPTAIPVRVLLCVDLVRTAEHSCEGAIGALKNGITTCVVSVAERPVVIRVRAIKRFRVGNVTSNLHVRLSDNRDNEFVDVVVVVFHELSKPHGTKQVKY